MTDQPTAPVSARRVVGDWMESALCAQTDPDAFNPEKGGSPREAKAVCAHCPVRAECLEYGLQLGDLHGIYGGLTAHERRLLVKTRKNHTATHNNARKVA